MATRNFPALPQSNILKLVTYAVTLIGAGTGKAPTLGSGDTSGTFFSAPVYTSTGIFTLTTLDPFPYLVSAQFSLAGSAGVTSGVFENPVAVQNANNTWTFTLNTYVASSLTDIATTQRIRCLISFQNSGNPYAG